MYRHWKIRDHFYEYLLCRYEELGEVLEFVKDKRTNIYLIMHKEDLDFISELRDLIRERIKGYEDEPYKTKYERKYRENEEYDNW